MQNDRQSVLIAVTLILVALAFQPAGSQTFSDDFRGKYSERLREKLDFANWPGKTSKTLKGIADKDVCATLAQHVGTNVTGIVTNQMLLIQTLTGYVTVRSLSLGKLDCEIVWGETPQAVHEYIIAELTAPRQQINGEEQVKKAHAPTSELGDFCFVEDQSVIFVRNNVGLKLSSRLTRTGKDLIENAKRLDDSIRGSGQEEAIGSHVVQWIRDTGVASSGYRTNSAVVIDTPPPPAGTQLLWGRCQGGHLQRGKTPLEFAVTKVSEEVSCELVLVDTLTGAIIGKKKVVVLPATTAGK